MDSGEKKKKSLGISVAEGSFAAVMQSVFDQFLTPFAVAIGSSAPQIGFLRAFPQLGAALVQLIAPDIADYYKDRKKIVVLAVLLQALMWVGMLGIALWLRSPLFLIIAASLVSLFGGISAPLWSAWMGDLTEPRSRASFFAMRNRVSGIASFVAILSFGFMLNHFQALNNVFIGFAILFAVATGARLVSYYLLKQMHEPHFEVKERYKYGFAEFLRELPSTNLGKFVVFISLMSFSMNLASPFFSVYVLKELNYDYIQYTVFTLVSTIASFMFVTYWAERSNMLGNRIIFVICASVMPIMPLLWLFTSNFFFITLIQTFGNFAYVGFSLTSTNFLYDAAAPGKRTRAIAYTNVLIGLAIFAGASIGGLVLALIPKPNIFASNFHALFVIAAVARLFVILVFARKVQEARVIGGEKRKDSDMLVKLIITDPMKEVVDNVAMTAGSGFRGAVSVHGKLRNAGMLTARVVGQGMDAIPYPKDLISERILPRKKGKQKKAKNRKK